MWRLSLGYATKLDTNCRGVGFAIIYYELLWFVVGEKCYNIKTNDFMSVFLKIIDKFRYIYWSRQVGSHDGYFSIQPKCDVCNPKCLHFGKNVAVGEYTYLGPVIEEHGRRYSPSIAIGAGTWVGKHCSIAAIDNVTIGRNVLFAGYVHITDHSHGYEDINMPITPQPLISKGPIIIDDDCWLGFGSEILSGVHIGKHSIVAARAVVTKDVPPYTIVAGNPAKIVKQYNFDTKRWEKVQKQRST